MCFECKKFRHFACNCRNNREEEKRMSVLQNRFKALSSRVMKCGVENKKQEVGKEEGKSIHCFKCRKEEHQWKECPKKKEERIVWVAAPQKVQPKKELACSIRRNVQENKMRCFEYEKVGH